MGSEIRAVVFRHSVPLPMDRLERQALLPAFLKVVGDDHTIHNLAHLCRPPNLELGELFAKALLAWTVNRTRAVNAGLRQHI